MNDQRENNLNPKRPKKGTARQLQTHVMPTDDVEYTNVSNMGGDLLFPNKLWVVPRGIERMP